MKGAPRTGFPLLSYTGWPDPPADAITGTLAVTLADTTSAAAGASGASGTLAVTLDNLTSAAAGGSGASGTVAVTLANLTSTASGSTVTGTVARTLADTTSTASGASGASGTVAKTLADVTSTASGSTVTGTVAKTLADVTSSAAGGSGASGTLSITLANVTSAASGSSVTGTVARTLDNTTSSASGTVTGTVSGTLAVTLADATSSAAGFYGLAVGNAQNNTVTAAGTTGITITKPTDLIDGDVMYAFISRTTFSNNAAWTCSGWTDIGPAAANAGTTVGNDRQTTILRKVVTTASGEPANYTFVNTQATSYQIVGIIVNVHGANTTTPEDAAVPAYNFNSDDATPASRNVTSVAAGALVIQYCQLSLATTAPVTPGAPSTYTLVPNGNAAETAGGATDNQAVTAYKFLGASGSTAGTNVWTHTPDDATTETLITCVAVRPLIATVSGTLAVTLDNLTSASAGASGASGTLAKTLADTTSIATGASGASGTLAKTLDSVTCAAAGSFANAIVGTLAETLDDSTIVAAGTHIASVTGTVARTLDDLTSDTAGGSGYFGTVNVTLEDLTSAAAGFSGYIVTNDPFAAKCTIRRQRFARRLRYHQAAERPALNAWAINIRGALIDFSDPTYTFTFRVGNIDDEAVLVKTTNIFGQVGTGRENAGTPNISILWEPGELDIEVGIYPCQLIARSVNLDEVFHGTIQILDAI